MVKRWKAPFVLCIFVVAMMGFGAWYDHQARQAPPTIIKGTITMYTDLPNNVTSLLAQQYQEEHHMQVNVLPLTQQQMETRMKEGDTNNGDVVITTKDNLVMGAKEGLFQPVLSENIDLVSLDFKDEDNKWVGFYYDPLVFVENTTFFNGLGQFITTWETVEKPGTWTAVISDFGASQSSANTLYSFVEKYGNDNAMMRLKRMEAHITQHAKYLDTPIRLASLGEVNVGIGNFSDANYYVANGYPVKMIFPQDGTTYNLVGVAVTANSLQREESIAFVNWLLSKHVAEVMQHNGFYFFFTNPEVPDPKDSFNRPIHLWDIKGGYTVEGKKAILNTWLRTVRFNK